jgi:hypothetical protein
MSRWATPVTFPPGLARLGDEPRAQGIADDGNLRSLLASPPELLDSTFPFATAGLEADALAFNGAKRTHRFLEDVPKVEVRRSGDDGCRSDGLTTEEPEAGSGAPLA